jgi:tRNA1Val (adenine37-N6)-methyltransferase
MNTFRITGMPNQWFRFKNFLVRQEAAAMKVCTDACLFGAMVSFKIEQENWKVKRALDIGTGTGLLSLMIAQKVKTDIDAVEIDTAAATEAAENIVNAGYEDRVRVLPGDITTMQFSAKYDLLICNPPFFQNHLKSKDEKRKIALHADTLNFYQLSNLADRLLHADGIFAVLLPYQVANSFIAATAMTTLYLSEQVLVKQTPKHGYFRSILFFKRVRTELTTWELCIKEGDKYSEKFVELLRDYYLYL